MLIRPSFYAVFPPNALKLHTPITIHLGDADGKDIQACLLSNRVTADCKNNESIELKIELKVPNAEPILLDIVYSNMNFNLLVQVQKALSANAQYRDIPAGNLADFILDQVRPGETYSRLGNYVRDRSTNQTVSRSGYLGRLKVNASTLNEKLESIRQQGGCAGDIGRKQIKAIIEAVLGNYAATREVFKDPWCFAGASLPASFSTQMAAWSRIAELISHSNTSESKGVLSSSRITYSKDAVQNFLNQQDIPLAIVGGHQWLDVLLKEHAEQNGIPLLKVPKRQQHQDFLLRLIGQQLISEKDHWTSRGAQGRMARSALGCDHIKQHIPVASEKHK